MNSGATSERVYDALKRRILGHGFRPGERLDPARLGDDLHSSVTPVRDALHILTGEGLVETRTSEGFHLPQVDGPGLEDLYEWNAQVLTLALKGRTSNLGRRKLDRLSFEISQPAIAVADLFARIAARSGNAEHAREIASLNDRLQAVRLAEAQLLNGCEEEFSNLLAASGAEDLPGLRAAIGTYHRRRRTAVAEIIRVLYRAG